MSNDLLAPCPADGQQQPQQQQQQQQQHQPVTPAAALTVTSENEPNSIAAEISISTKSSTAPLVPPVVCRSLFVENLHPECEFTHLYHYFSRFGEVTSVRILRDAKKGISRGIGYVNFSRESDAVNAFERTDGVHGIPLVCRDDDTPLHIRYADQEQAARHDDSKLFTLHFLPTFVTKAELLNVLAPFGDVVECNIVSRSAARGPVKGSAVEPDNAADFNVASIEFSTSKAATRAACRLHRSCPFGPQPLHVKPDVKHTAPPRSGGTTTSSSPSASGSSFRTAVPNSNAVPQQQHQHQHQHQQSTPSTTLHRTTPDASTTVSGVARPPIPSDGQQLFYPQPTYYPPQHHQFFASAMAPSFGAPPHHAHHHANAAAMFPYATPHPSAFGGAGGFIPLAQPGATSMLQTMPFPQLQQPQFMYVGEDGMLRPAAPWPAAVQQPSQTNFMAAPAMPGATFGTVPASSSTVPMHTMMSPFHYAQGFQLQPPIAQPSLQPSSAAATGPIGPLFLDPASAAPFAAAPPTATPPS